MHLFSLRYYSLLIIFSLASLSCSDKKLALFERPLSVQYAIDKAFIDNQRNGNKPWKYNGDSAYYLLNLHDGRLLKHLLHRYKNNNDKKEITIMDVGCGDGTWGNAALDMLEKEVVKCNKKVSIFSITGATECDNQVISQGNVTLHHMNNFKIENIDKELTKKGVDLRNKVDLIVSRWTLRHLVDPFGTLKRLYSLLSPYHGALLSNGFLFGFNDTQAVQDFPDSQATWSIMEQSGAIPLFRFYNDAHDIDQFLLLRPHRHELILPLEYTGDIRSLGLGYQCESKAITVFKKKAVDNKEKSTLYPMKRPRGKFSYEPYYCNEKNEQSKELYEYLVNHNLFK